MFVPSHVHSFQATSVRLWHRNWIRCLRGYGKERTTWSWKWRLLKWILLTTSCSHFLPAEADDWYHWGGFVQATHAFGDLHALRWCYRFNKATRYRTDIQFGPKYRLLASNYTRWWSWAHSHRSGYGYFRRTRLESNERPSGYGSCPSYWSEESSQCIPTNHKRNSRGENHGVRFYFHTTFNLMRFSRLNMLSSLSS